MRKQIKWLYKIPAAVMFALYCFLSLATISPIYAQDDNFGSILEESVAPIEGNLNTQFGDVNRGAQGIRDALIYIAEEIIIPLVIVIGLVVGIIGFYKLFFSGSDDEIGKGVSILQRGIIAIVIMISARWLTFAFIGSSGAGGALIDASSGEVRGILAAQEIYDTIIYPLLRLGVFLILGILFIILLSRVFSFIFSSDDSARKKATTIIVRNTIGILVILAAQAIVESIYGQREQVLNINATDLGQIGTSIFETRNIPLVYEIINRILGITSLIILVVILVQAFQLLLKPNDEDKIKKIGKSLLYILIGVIIIGAAYLIVNVLLVE